MSVVRKSPCRWALPGLVAAVLLQACGGGGGGDDDARPYTYNPNPNGVTIYNGVSSSYLGTVSGLGSVVVNGVRFETTSSMVMDSDDVYGATLFSRPLALGMTVAVQGTADEAQYLGSASKIRVIGGVRGVVTSNTEGVMTIGGQAVVVTANTLYADALGQPALQVPVGSYVNVDGLMQADLRFVATRVTLSSPTNFTWDAAWRGQSSAAVRSGAGLNLVLNAGGENFNVTCPVSSCSVEPAGANLTGTHAIRVLALDDGQRRGVSIVASKIQVLDASEVLNWGTSAVGLAKVKGVASTDGQQWRVAGIAMLTSVAAPWVAGQFYEVKGVLSNGQMTVSTWELEGQESYRAMAGAASGASYYRNELYGAVSQLQGTRMVVQGVTVDVSQAYFERGSSVALTDGAYVEVKGVMNGGVLQAQKIEIKTSTVAGQGTRFEVYGTVSDWSATGFSLNSGGTVYKAVLTPRSYIDPEHGMPANGRFVEVKGYMSGADFVVIEVETKSGGRGDDD